jgi:putative oxygen-independent coproporphyrinogen III oxidase
VEHLYVHVPFCAHRCGYCDFVTVTGSGELHGRYLDALIGELGDRCPAPRLHTVFVGGGTPSLLDDELLERLLEALPEADELTVECNPETITPAKARVLAAGTTRISLGAQSFQPHLLATLERLARPAAIERAVEVLREAGVTSLNLDLMFGVPGQSPADLEADLDHALRLGPDHISYYELEAKPGTRFTYAHGAELQRQADLMEGYYERVVGRLREAGFRWYETANFCRQGHEARHNVAYWTGRDYVGVGIGAVSTVAGERRRNRPSLPAYLAAAPDQVPHQIELLDERQLAVERLMLGLRLDRPLELDGLGAALDREQLERLSEAGLVERGDGTIQLSERGRFVANDVVSRLLA